MKINGLLQELWDDYTSMAPSALFIHELMQQRGENVVNDHIALRTFSHESIGIDQFAIHFEKFGYKRCGDYEFEAKKLDAIHLEHSCNSKLPKIFLSELRYNELSKNSIEIIERCIEPLKLLSIDSLLAKPLRPSISFREYKQLYEESEYAAWLCAIGFRANHFTISVNHLKTIESLLDLNEILKENGILLNTSGGEVKGSKSEFLEQSSTMADKMDVEFTDCTEKVPTCYYEFALRHQLPTGKLYQGFVTKSADKIFESTN
ncbi:DUF1338 domain-containing protein [Halobacteriovorax sp. HLS]|uniref:DUF1338 domain-containing protein n=1 Tax=Halobacteriovorax sp. HLS TaxID=2234000 RepID=UPI000FDBFB52|nr:DUF1338 domain-containing protein [Halobacteriovorax sp. HLS]